jgi:hypothetical protein
MRLWTLHPRYLDARGLVALWREALLARAVLRGETAGYRHHPQLARFRSSPRPVSALNRYLVAIYQEAVARGYRFDRRKLGRAGRGPRLRATQGQLSHEWRHLLGKLRRRSPALYRQLRGIRRPRPHPLFRIAPGPVASWERSTEGSPTTR